MEGAGRPLFYPFTFEVISMPRRIAPGLWVDDLGALHLAVPELLVRFGWEDTPANRALVVEQAKAFFAATRPRAAITVREKTTTGEIVETERIEPS
jgi:hypothetical protein